MGMLANDIKDGNAGTLQNGATATAVGKVGQAFSFDGVDDRVQIADHPSLDLSSGELTLEAWVKPDSCTARIALPIITKESPTAHDAYILSTNFGTPVPLWAFAASTSGSDWETLILAGTCTPGVWIHLAATQTAGIARLYQNEVEVGTDTTAVIPPNTDLPLFIGYREGILSAPGLQGGYFPGLIDEVGIYNRALTLQELINAQEQGVDTTALQRSLVEGVAVRVMKALTVVEALVGNDNNKVQEAKVLVEEGQTLLAAAQFKDALDAFRAALQKLSEAR